MSTKTSIAVIAAVLFGSASFAFANDQFDVNIYRPAIPGSALDAFALSPTNPNGAKGVVRPFTGEEKLMFDRAQQE
jgi:hypothetical protein